MDDEDWDTSVTAAEHFQSHGYLTNGARYDGSNAGSSSEAVRVQGGPGDSLVDLQYERLKARYEDAGYREGIEPGKLSTLQSGFDTGFEASVAPSRRLGQLRGRAQVLVQLSGKIKAPSGDDGLGDRARTLLSDLNRVKREKVLAVDHEAEAHARMEHPEDFPPDADADERRRRQQQQGGVGTTPLKDGSGAEASLPTAAAAAAAGPFAVDEALGFVKEGSRREMEALEGALERLSGGGRQAGSNGEGLREEALLAALEKRVVELETSFGLKRRRQEA